MNELIRPRTLVTVDGSGQNVHAATLAGARSDLGHQAVVHSRRDHGDVSRFLPPAAW